MDAIASYRGDDLCYIGAALAADLTGRASVIDADTLEIRGNGIRLWGVDAPESNQLCRSEVSLQYRCGARTADELAAFIGNRPVSCKPVTLDRYGRIVASCAVNGVDLADWLATGWRWIGRATASVDTPLRKMKPGAVNAGYGQAALPGRGGFANA